MPSRNAPLYSIILIITDIVALFLAFTLAYILRVQIDSRPLVNEVYALDFFVTFLSIVPFWIVTFASLGLYNRSVYSKRISELGRLFIGSVVGILIVVGYAYIINEPVFPARLVPLYVLVGSFLFVVLARWLVHAIRAQLFRFNIGISRVLVIGSSATTSDIAAHISDTKSSGFKVVAVAGPKKVIPSHLAVQHFPSINTALNKIDTLGVTTIIQTDLFEDPLKNERILDAAQTFHIHYNFIPGESEFYAGKSTVDIFLGYPMISVSQTPLTGWGVVGKRMFDLVVASLIVVLLSPVILLVMLLQKLLNPGPIFYKSKRLTRFSQPFGMFKFRSMRPDVGKKDAVQDFIDMGRPDLAKEYEKNRKILSCPDPRITRFGHFIRKTSLDELPQLFNVLRGELSLVGPRPIEPVELSRYKKKGSLLLSVKSGLTGLWQVSGRNDLSFEQRVELELYYAQNWSFWLDLKILLKTPETLLKRRGVPGANNE